VCAAVAAAAARPAPAISVAATAIFAAEATVATRVADAAPRWPLSSLSPPCSRSLAHVPARFRRRRHSGRVSVNEYHHRDIPSGPCELSSSPPRPTQLTVFSQPTWPHVPAGAAAGIAAALPAVTMPKFARTLGAVPRPPPRQRPGESSP
jgi:hypothetical protein